MSAIVLAIGFGFVQSFLAFLIGSIPFGYLIGRFFYSTDLRTQGSGNIGAMNALRTLGKGGAVAVLLLDALKGALPVLLGRLFWGNADLSSQWLLAALGIAAVLGHCFSPWLGWKGGKGVATSFGVIFALSWPAGMVCVLAWVLGGLIVTQYSSVGSMLANLVSPIALWSLTGSLPFTIYGLFAGLFIVWTHRENIARLRSGTENRIGLFRGKSRARR
jgi:glycerol-3-phosphate acyltransferase PlsY